MTKIQQQVCDSFNDSELTDILEAARVALSDAEIFDALCDKTDVADEEMLKLRDKLEDFGKL